MLLIPLPFAGDLSRAGDWVLRGQQQPGRDGHRVQSGPAPARPQLQHCCGGREQQHGVPARPRLPGNQ